VGVQDLHQRRSRHHDPDPRVATTVAPPLGTLRQAKPTLQIKVLRGPFLLLRADEEAGKEAEHHRRHRVPDRILGLLELVDQRLELLLPLRAIFGPGLEGRSHLRDHLDGFSDYLLLRDYASQ
jgi:hypothetical protein